MSHLDLALSPSSLLFQNLFRKDIRLCNLLSSSPDPAFPLAAQCLKLMIMTKRWRAYLKQAIKRLLFFFIRSHRQKKSYSFCQRSPAVSCLPRFEWWIIALWLERVLVCITEGWRNHGIICTFTIYGFKKPFNSYLNYRWSFILSSYIVHTAFMALKARLHFHTII